jgi:hypothetical protein
MEQRLKSPHGFVLFVSGIVEYSERENDLKEKKEEKSCLV